MRPNPHLVCMEVVTENLLKRQGTALLLRHIAHGPVTQAELCEQGAPFTASAINERLRAMIRYNLIARIAIRGGKLSVSYRLTERGHKVLCLLDLIYQLDSLTIPSVFNLGPFKPSDVPVTLPPTHLVAQ